MRNIRKILKQKMKMEKRVRVKMKKVARKKTVKKQMMMRRINCWMIQMSKNVLQLETLMHSRKGISHLR